MTTPLSAEEVAAWRSWHRPDVDVQCPPWPRPCAVSRLLATLDAVTAERDEALTLLEALRVQANITMGRALDAEARLAVLEGALAKDGAGGPAL